MERKEKEQHQVSTETLLLFAYQELAEPEAARVGSHLVDCASCRAALEEVQMVRKVAHDPNLPLQPSPEILVSLQSAARKALPQKPRPVRIREWLRETMFPWRAVAAAAALVLLVVALAWWVPQREHDTEPMQAMPASYDLAYLVAELSSIESEQDELFSSSAGLITGDSLDQAITGMNEELNYWMNGQNGDMSSGLAGIEEEINGLQWTLSL